MNLTEHFTLAELTRSNTALRLGLDNTPPTWIVANLRLMAHALELVRFHYGVPIKVYSGYRSAEVNQACGGSQRSRHKVGLAADFTVPGIPVIEVCRWIAANLTGWDQVIYEFGPGGWVHFGLGDDRRPVRHQTLSAVKQGGKTVYLPGIQEAV